MKKIFIAIFSIILLSTASFAVEGTNKTIKVNKLISDEISQKGEVDCFNFTLSKAGSVQIDFDFDIDFSYVAKLVNVENNILVQTTNFSSNLNSSSGRAEKSSNKIRIPKGEYQLQIYCSNFSEDFEEYEFEIIYDEEKSDRYEKESNNTPKTAMIIECNDAVIGNLESISDVDYFMVEVPHNGEIYTELGFAMDASYNVEMYSEANNSLKLIKSKKYEAKLNPDSDVYYDSSEKVRVPEGNYYFKISRSGEFCNKDYEFTVRYIKNSQGNYEIESNNEAKTANELSINSAVIGNLSSNYDVDYYRVSNYGYNKYSLKMNLPQGAAYNVIIYKEENGSLTKVDSEVFSNKNAVNEIIGKEHQMSYGDYYFKISSNTYSNEDYTFSVMSQNDSYTYYGNKTIILEINNPYMMVNGQTHSIDENRGTAPVIVNGRTLLPIRAIIESLGGTVTWADSTSGIDIKLGNNSVHLTLNSTIAYVNGTQKWLDVAPTSINGRTMVPVKFVMDNLGGNVAWDAMYGRVTITY